MVRADLHLHTISSIDGMMRPEELIAACVRRGLSVVAITDHNTIAAAYDIAKKAPFHVIIGEEIDTREGELIGYFLKEEISPGGSAVQVAEEIKRQGGLVCVPHPFDLLRHSHIREKALLEIVEIVDIIEVANGRVVLPQYNWRAKAFAEKHGKAPSAGSDAHFSWEVGDCFVLMEEFRDREEFLRNLRTGKIVRTPRAWVSFAGGAGTKIVKFFRGVKE